MVPFEFEKEKKRRIKKKERIGGRLNEGHSGAP